MTLIRGVDSGRLLMIVSHLFRPASVGSSPAVMRRDYTQGKEMIDMQNNGKTMRLGAMTASAILLMLAVCIVPVSAADDVFTDNNQTYAAVANYGGARFDIFGNNTYYFNFSKPTGGLNAIHITDSPSSLDGGVYTDQLESGTLYISDTSTDTQYHDDVILLFAVPSDAAYSNLNLLVNVSGYQWTPTGSGSKPNLDYDDDYYTTLTETFYSSDFLSGTSSWRPAPLDNYPIYYGQGANEQFKIMLIDLYAGSVNQTSLRDNGTVRVDYNLTGYEGAAYFDTYAWNNQSAQGQGISWTNKIIGTGSSGWAIEI